METDPKNSPPEGAPEGAPEDAEKAYWAKFEGVMDTWFDKKVKTLRETSSSRQGRTTLPKVLADIVFGPEKVK